MIATTEAPATLAVTEPVAGVLLVELDVPERRNALSSRLLADLAAVIRAADVRAAVLAGRGAAFSAGYDLREAAPAPERFDAQAAERLVARPDHEAFAAMETAKFPIVAAVHGAALGGGLELICCCDVRVAAVDATFGVPAGRLGLTYSAAGLERVARVFGASVVREMVLFDRRPTAARAERIGAVAEMVADRDAAITRALALARATLPLAPRALAANRRILGELDRQPLASHTSAVLAELDALRARGFGADGELAARVRAFLSRAERSGVRPHPAPTKEEAP